jgi:hypothetical protein
MIAAKTVKCNESHFEGNQVFRPGNPMGRDGNVGVAVLIQPDVRCTRNPTQGSLDEA